MKTSKQSMKAWMTKWKLKNAIRHYQRELNKVDNFLALGKPYDKIK